MSAPPVQPKPWASWASELSHFVRPSGPSSDSGVSKPGDAMPNIGAPALDTKLSGAWSAEVAQSSYTPRTAKQMFRSNHTAALLAQPESPAPAGVLRAVRETVTRDAAQIAVVLRALDAFNDRKLCPGCEGKFISVYMPICGHPLCSACKDLLPRAELGGHVACPTCLVLLRPLDWLNIHTSPHSSIGIYDDDDVRADSPVSGVPLAAAPLPSVVSLHSYGFLDAASTPVAASPPVAPPSPPAPPDTLLIADFLSGASAATTVPRPSTSGVRSGFCCPAYTNTHAHHAQCGAISSLLGSSEETSALPTLVAPHEEVRTVRSTKYLSVYPFRSSICRPVPRMRTSIRTASSPT